MAGRLACAQFKNMGLMCREKIKVWVKQVFELSQVELTEFHCIFITNQSFGHTDLVIKGDFGQKQTKNFRRDHANR